MAVQERLHPNVGDVFGNRHIAQAAAVERPISEVGNAVRDRVTSRVAFTLERRGIPRIEARQKVLPIMKLLGIEKLASRSPHRLSHGQMQRVALAGALVANPPLLLLDEPSAALDPVGKEELAGLLVSLNAAMLIATHDIDFARRVCTRFIVLVDGAVTEDVADPELVTRYGCQH